MPSLCHRDLPRDDYDTTIDLVRLHPADRLLADRVLVGARFAWRFAQTFEDYAPYFMPYTVDLDVGLRF